MPNEWLLSVINTWLTACPCQQMETGQQVSTWGPPPFRKRFPFSPRSWSVAGASCSNPAPQGNADAFGYCYDSCNGHPASSQLLFCYHTTPKYLGPREVFGGRRHSAPMGQQSVHEPQGDLNLLGQEEQRGSCMACPSEDSPTLGSFVYTNWN